MKVEMGRPRVMAEPNLVPLIDVALILVIIFMVLTPILVQSQLTIKLPKASSGAPADAGATVHVQITRLGVLVIDGRATKWEELDHELSLHLAKSGQKTVLVEADHTVPVERVVAVLDAAKKLGVGKLGIGVVASGS